MNYPHWSPRCWRLSIRVVHYMSVHRFQCHFSFSSNCVSLIYLFSKGHLIGATKVVKGWTPGQRRRNGMWSWWGEFDRKLNNFKCACVVGWARACACAIVFVRIHVRLCLLSDVSIAKRPPVRQQALTSSPRPLTCRTFLSEPLVIEAIYFLVLTSFVCSGQYLLPLLSSYTHIEERERENRVQVL